MNILIDQLVKSVLQRDSLEHCSVEELQQLANQFPYFGPAQLLLTKKLQAENAEQYNEQVNKTSLFFHNPLWLDRLMNNAGNADIIEADSFGAIQQAEKEMQDSIVSEINNEPITLREQKKPEPSISLPTFKLEPFDPLGTELIFEPYHTVDYFASQGIKFREEEKPKDKFGQQLKSFTEWLKTMKRLPVSAMTQTTEPDAEKKVEQLAQHSLQDREVITETMAEVWEKQGNSAKAIDVYNKLSLLDPLKSAYFAAKIEELKNKLL